jgi:hypothetical protein
MASPRRLIRLKTRNVPNWAAGTAHREPTTIVQKAMAAADPAGLVVQS